MRTWTIEPEEGWQPGDRAYCVQGSRGTSPTLEVGKVYEVESVIPVKGCVSDGLVLAGMTLPGDNRGVWSGRFVKLLPGLSSLRQVDVMATPVWLDAYRASVGQIPRPVPPPSPTPSKRGE